MTGLDEILNNISANNGWAISILGISIVFTGLTLLSLTISQLHKVLYLWENREQVINNFKGRFETQKGDDEPLPDLNLSKDVKIAAQQFKLLVDRIGEPIHLPKLLDLAVKRGLFKPYSTLNKLIIEGVLVPDGNGYYTWKKQ